MVEIKYTTFDGFKKGGLHVRTSVNMKLVAGDNQREHIQTSSDPTIHGVQIIAIVYFTKEFVGVPLTAFFFVQWKIFKQSHAVEVVKDAH